jgi:hypothetical protein
VTSRVLVPEYSDYCVTTQSETRYICYSLIYFETGRRRKVHIGFGRRDLSESGHGIPKWIWESKVIFFFCFNVHYCQFLRFYEVENRSLVDIVLKEVVDVIEVYPDICFKRFMQTTKYLNVDIWYQGWDSNNAPSREIPWTILHS